MMRTARLLSAPHRDWTGRVDWLGLRDRAMLLVAYDTALRASELVAIEVEHIEGPAHDGSGCSLSLNPRRIRKGRGGMPICLLKLLKRLPLGGALRR